MDVGAFFYKNLKCSFAQFAALSLWFASLSLVFTVPVAAQVIESDPMIVEGEASLPTGPKRSQRLDFTGAKARQPTKNDFAVELRSMSREPLVSRWWREGYWVISEPLGKRYQWRASKLDISRTSSIRTRSWFQSARTRIELEGGLKQDIGDPQFLDNKNTPLDGSDDSVKAIERKMKTGYGSLKLVRRDFGFLGAWDLDNRRVFLGQSISGIRRKQEGDFAFLFRLGNFNVRPFVQFYRKRLDSDLSFLRDSDSRELRSGLIATTKYLGLKHDLQLAYSEKKRSIITVSEQEFQRREIEYNTYLNSPQKVGPINILGSTGFAFVSDEEVGGVSNNQFMWSAELEGRTNFWQQVGLQANIVRFAEAPKPSEVFGDTSLIQANLDLVPYAGFRGAVGPWYSAGALEGKFEFIWERGKGEKVTLVNFPTARTEAIGGTYMRGLRSNHTLNLGPIVFKGGYTYQQALNASSIEWQRGFPIPGRPEHELRLSGAYTAGPWSYSLSYAANFNTPFDLVGTAIRESDSNLSASVSWESNSLFLRLYGTGLFSDVLDGSDFFGATPSGILEPELLQQTFGLEMEISL